MRGRNDHFAADHMQIERFNGEVESVLPSCVKDARDLQVMSCLAFSIRCIMYAIARQDNKYKIPDITQVWQSLQSVKSGDINEQICWGFASLRNFTNQVEMQL